MFTTSPGDRSSCVGVPVEGYSKMEIVSHTHFTIHQMSQVSLVGEVLFGLHRYFLVFSGQGVKVIATIEILLNKMYVYLALFFPICTVEVLLRV